MEEIVTSRQQLANRDHDAALYYILNPTEIRIVEEDHWQVGVAEDGRRKGAIRYPQTAKKCPSECQMICRVCEVCPHMFTCTCYKNTHESGRIACAHIHAIHYMVGASAEEDDDDDDFHIERLPADSTDKSVLDRTIEFVSSETDADVPPSPSTQGSLKDAIAEAAHLQVQLQTWPRRHENADGSASVEWMLNCFKQMKDIFIEATAQNDSSVLPFEPVDKSRQCKMSLQRQLSSFQQCSKKRAKAMTEEEIAEQREENEQLERFLELQEDADV
uniref:SWIM-type domain-containing protein n=1 Tax=Plectus sambesii TaxID=2011161 RepID=A0A914VF78_9BILA